MQLGLFGACPRVPFQKESAESREAALKICPHLGKLQRRVLEVIRNSGDFGVTDNEIIEISGLGGSTVRPRRIELFEKRLIFRIGTRKTKSGRSAAVWGCRDA